MFEKSLKPGMCILNKRGQHMPICGTEYGAIPEYPVFAQDGTVIAYGWRRAVKVVLQRKLTTREKVKKVFGAGFFERRNEPTGYTVEGSPSDYNAMLQSIYGEGQQVEDSSDPIIIARRKMELDNVNRKGTPGLTFDQADELSKKIREGYSDELKEKLDKIDFEFEKKGLMKKKHK